MGQLCKATIFASVLWAVAIFGSVNADALSFNDIAGSWCTGGGIERFTKNSLVAIISSTGQRLEYKIVKYEFTKTLVTVYWISTENKKVSTDFSEFSVDKRNMIQLKSESGPRREFHRC